MASTSTHGSPVKSRSTDDAEDDIVSTSPIKPSTHRLSRDASPDKKADARSHRPAGASGGGGAGSPKKAKSPFLSGASQQPTVSISSSSPQRPSQAAWSSSSPKPSTSQANGNSSQGSHLKATHAHQQSPTTTSSDVVVLSSSSSGEPPVEDAPRRSSRSSSKRQSLPPPLPTTSSTSKPSISSLNGRALPAKTVAEQHAQGSTASTPTIAEPRSDANPSTSTSTAVGTASPTRPANPTPYFADLSPAAKDVKPNIAFVPSAADQAALRVIKDDAGRDVIDLEDTDDEEQSDDEDDDDEEDEDESNDDEDDVSGGVALEPSDGEGLNTEDDGRRTEEDSGMEGDDDEEEDDDGETDADASAMEIDSHLELESEPRSGGGLEAKLDALHSPRPPLAPSTVAPSAAVGTPQRNASAGPSQRARVPGFDSGASSDFTSPTSSAVAPSGAAGVDGAVNVLQPKKKVKRARKESTPPPDVPIKPEITLRLSHPIKLGQATEFSLYEKALETGQYDEPTVEHFSHARILKAIQAKQAAEAAQSVKKRRRVKGMDETPEEILARSLVEKYESKTKRKRDMKEDFYDLNDGFVDDSTYEIDQPEYAGIPKEEGFFVHMGDLELQELPDEPDEERHKKKRKGSVDSGSDGPGKIKNQMQRKQTNLSHLLVQKTVETLSKGQHAEMQDVNSSSTTVAATITTTTTSAGGQPGLPINGHDAKPGPSTSAAPAPAPFTTVIPVIGTNSQPTQVAIPDALVEKVQNLKELIKAHDWSNKKVFPAHLRPEIHTLVEAAIACDWYGPEFFNLMPMIFPYNRFTMLKLIRRQEVTFHVELLEKQKANLIDEFQNEVDRVKDDQIARFEIAMQEWEDRQAEKALQQANPALSVPGGTPASTIVMSPETAAGLPGAVNPVAAAASAVHSPEMGLSQLPFANGAPTTPNSKPTLDDKPPKKLMRLDQKMRDLLWTLYNITEEVVELKNEVAGWENKKHDSALVHRKALYVKLAACFPDGFMHTTDISRAVSALKLKFKREDDNE